MLNCSLTRRLVTNLEYPSLAKHHQSPTKKSKYVMHADRILSEHLKVSKTCTWAPFEQSM